MDFKMEGGSRLTKEEIDAALQLIQLISVIDSRRPTTAAAAAAAANDKATHRKLKFEEEQSEGDSTADHDVDSPSSIEKILQRRGKLYGNRKRKRNEGERVRSEKKAAAQRLIQLSEGEEDSSTSNIVSYITDDASSSSVMGTGLEERENEAKGEADEVGGGSKSDTSNDLMEECLEALSRGRKRRKFRSLVDIYRTTKPLNMSVGS